MPLEMAAFLVIVCPLGLFPRLQRVQDSSSIRFGDSLKMDDRQSEIPIPLRTVCCKLIDSVRIILRIVWLSLFKANQ